MILLDTLGCFPRFIQISPAFDFPTAGPGASAGHQPRPALAGPWPVTAADLALDG